MKRILSLLCVITIFTTMVSANMKPKFSLQNTPRNIEKEVLKITPLGSAMITVENMCVKQKWKCLISRNTGFLKQEDGQVSEVIGSKFISTDLDDYPRDEHSIVSTSIFWGFDKAEKLIEVWVWKTIDAP